MEQREIKLVLFSPTDGHYAVDIYVNGERVYCGRGWPTEQRAMSEAITWLQVSNGEPA